MVHAARLQTRTTYFMLYNKFDKPICRKLYNFLPQLSSIILCGFRLGVKASTPPARPAFVGFAKLHLNLQS